MVSFFARIPRPLRVVVLLALLAAAWAGAVAVSLALMPRETGAVPIVLIVTEFAFFLVMFLMLQAKGLRQFSGAALVSVLLLAVLSLVYLLVRNHSPRWDLTKNGRYSLAPQTRAIVQRLRKRVVIEVLATANEPYYSYLRQLVRLNDRITFHVRNPYREIAVRRGPGEEMRVNDIWIQSGEKKKRIQFNAESDVRGLEKEIANGILAVTQDKDVVVYFATRHGEKSPEPIGGEQGRTRSLYDFAKLLHERAMQVDVIDLAREARVPDSCDALVVAGPLVDYSSGEIETVREYLERGGSLLALLDPRQSEGGGLPRLRALLADYGATVSDKAVADYQSYTAERSVFVPLVHNYNPAHPITENLQGLGEDMPLTLACSVEATPGSAAKFAVTPLMRTSDKSWELPFEELLQASTSKKVKVRSDEMRSFSLAVAVSPKTGVSSATASVAGPRLVVFGDSDFLTDAHLATAPATLGYFAVSWLTHQDELIRIPPRLVDDSPMVLKPSQRNLLSILSVVVIPFSIFLGGLPYTTLRRRRR